MQDTKKWVIGIVVAVVILVGVGPIFVAKIARKAFKTPKELITAPVRIKASGTISRVGGYLVLTTPQGLNHYILSGPNVGKIVQQADNLMFVFGTIARPATKQIDKMAIRAAIDVIQYDTKDFAVGSTMSTQVAEAINQKVKEKAEFRNRVLTKLGLKDSTYDVISGKLLIGKSVLIRAGKEMPALLVQDKYGDLYLLAGTFKYPREAYKSLLGKDIEIVVPGELTVPSPEIMVLNYQNFMTFSAKGIYNKDDEFSELNPGK